MNYQYDGTFIGLLTSIYDLFKDKNENNAKISKNSAIFNNKLIISDEEKAKKVYEKIKKSYYGENMIYYLYLSELRDIENLILKIIVKIIKNPNSYFETVDDDIILAKKIYHKVNKETHCMKGFVRFQKLNNNSYISVIDPDYNILTLIAPHFVNRFKKNSFIIFDEKRELAIIHEKDKDYQISKLSGEFKIDKSLYHDEEKYYQNLWKSYFDNIAIKERINPKLQKQFMPTRYWKNIVEIKE